MKKTTLTGIGVGCFLWVVFLSAPGFAMDCGGAWRTLQGYQGGGGGPCKVLGLNSRAGTCRPGDAYETLCDDRQGGQYKTCKGPRSCGTQSSGDCHTWDYNYGQSCPAGFYNVDCKGGCEKQ